MQMCELISMPFSLGGSGDGGSGGVDHLDNIWSGISFSTFLFGSVPVWVTFFFGGVLGSLSSVTLTSHSHQWWTLHSGCELFWSLDSFGHTIFIKRFVALLINISDDNVNSSFTFIWLIYMVRINTPLRVRQMINCELNTNRLSNKSDLMTRWPCGNVTFNERIEEEFFFILSFQFLSSFAVKKKDELHLNQHALWSTGKSRRTCLEGTQFYFEQKSSHELEDNFLWSLLYWNRTAIGSYAHVGGFYGNFHLVCSLAKLPSFFISSSIPDIHKLIHCMSTTPIMVGLATEKVLVGDNKLKIW